MLPSYEQPVTMNGRAMLKVTTFPYVRGGARRYTFGAAPIRADANKPAPRPAPRRSLNEAAHKLYR
jgi:hypothetical protein